MARRLSRSVRLSCPDSCPDQAPLRCPMPDHGSGALHACAPACTNSMPSIARHNLPLPAVRACRYAWHVSFRARGLTCTWKGLSEHTCLAGLPRGVSPLHCPATVAALTAARLPLCARAARQPLRPSFCCMLRDSRAIEETSLAAAPLLSSHCSPGSRTAQLPLPAPKRPWRPFIVGMPTMARDATLQLPA